MPDLRTFGAVDVVTAIVIDCPPDVVADYAMHPDNAPEWYVNIESVEWVTRRPLAVGSRLAFVARFLGQRLAYIYEVTELEPARRLVMRTAQGPFPMETTYEFEPADGGTRMRLRNRGTPAGVARFIAPLVAAAMARANRQDLARLRQILEWRCRPSADTAPGPVSFEG